MSGLERILEKIKADADAAVESILSDADKQANVLLEQGNADAERQYEALLQSTKADCAAKAEAARSAAEAQERQALLAARGAEIDRVIQQAMQVLNELPDGEYFDRLLLLIKRFAQPGKDGVVLFGEKDLARLPSDWMKRANDILPNGTLTLSEKPAPISNGFLIRYGEIEQNCTFDALLEDNRDRIRDRINELLFIRP